MAKGWNRVEQEVASQEARKEQFATSGSALYSKHIKEAGGAIVVRFCEQGQDVNVYERHEYKRPESQYPDRATCLHEAQVSDCPMHNAGLKIVVRTVLNLIYRNRPQLRKGSDGKALRDQTGNYIVDGYADQVVYWECSNTTADMLRRMDSEYRGLMSRDFKLQWTGAQFQPYALTPADVDGGPQPMSDADRALAAKKHDLDKIYAPPSIQEAAQIVAKYGANSGAGQSQNSIPSAVPNQAQPNPMLAGATLPPGASPFVAAQQAAAPTQQ